MEGASRRKNKGATEDLGAVIFCTTVILGDITSVSNTYNSMAVATKPNMAL
jgi:hypothetical protein